MSTEKSNGGPFVTFREECEILRAHSKGYAAGRKRQTLERTVENVRRERQAFLDKAFLALLPTARTQNSWKFGDKIVSTVEDRVKLASYLAKEALHKRPLV